MCGYDPRYAKQQELGHDFDPASSTCKRCGVTLDIAIEDNIRCGPGLGRCHECTLLRPLFGTPPRCQECLGNMGMLVD